jgi:hypothetical protein
MKRIIPIFLALILISGAFFFFSCKGKDPLTGTLSITARTKEGVITANNPVAIYIASSKDNLDNKIYVGSGWLDANGSKIFRDLQPTYYWYRVDGWDDYGAAEVFAGVDASVFLWLNTPSSSKK